MPGARGVQCVVGFVDAVEVAEEVVEIGHKLRRPFRHVGGFGASRPPRVAGSLEPLRDCTIYKTGGGPGATTPSSGFFFPNATHARSRRRTRWSLGTWRVTPWLPSLLA